MRVKSLTIAVAVLAVGAVPAVAAKQTALRTLPKPTVVVAPVAAPAIAPAPVVVVRPSAVWIPAPTGGIKWGVAKPAKRR